jgi:hypothetical protein
MVERKGIKMYNKILILLFTLVALIFGLSGCGSGGSDSGGSNNVESGQFIDSVVEGLGYQTETQSGLTNSNGEFKYVADEQVTFSIGGIVIGGTSGQSVITPVELVNGATDETHPIVTNIVRFLLTVDDDANPDNGITITEAVRTAAQDNVISFGQTSLDFEQDTNVINTVGELTTLTSAGVRSLVSVNQAQAHLNASLSELQGILVGTWGLVNLEGIPEDVGGPSGVDASNSTWTFHSDGTYDWFFYFDRGTFSYDEQSNGHYSLSGNSLSLDGPIVDELLSSSTIPISFSNNNTTFIIADDDGDHWTYSKLSGPQNGDTGGGNPPPDQGQGKAILIDSSRDGGIWWFPQSEQTGFSVDANHQGKLLANELRLKGYQVEELARGVEITTTLLQSYDIVARVGDFGTYSESELQAYDTYLSNGGPLLLVSEHRTNDTVDELAENLGLIFSGTVSGTITDFTEHEITNGVQSINYNAGSVILSQDLNNSINVLASISGDAAMGILSHPPARIFFIGDSNDLLLVKKPFVDNLFNWLAAQP